MKKIVYHTREAQLETKDHVQLTSMEPSHSVRVLSNSKIFTTHPACNEYANRDFIINHYNVTPCHVQQANNTRVYSLKNHRNM